MVHEGLVVQAHTAPLLLAALSVTDLLLAVGQSQFAIISEAEAAQLLLC